MDKKTCYMGRLYTVMRYMLCDWFYNHSCKLLRNIWTDLVEKVENVYPATVSEKKNWNLKHLIKNWASKALFFLRTIYILFNERRCIKNGTIDNININVVDTTRIANRRG